MPVYRSLAVSQEGVNNVDVNSRQLLIGLIALATLWKDWEDYGALSKRFSRKLPIVLALVTLSVTSLSVSQTYR